MIKQSKVHMLKCMVYHVLEIDEGRTRSIHSMVGQYQCLQADLGSHQQNWENSERWNTSPAAAFWMDQPGGS